MAVNMSSTTLQLGDYAYLYTKDFFSAKAEPAPEMLA